MVGRLQEYLAFAMIRDKPSDAPRDSSLDTKYTKFDESFAEGSQPVRRRKTEFSEDPHHSIPTARKSVFFKPSEGKESQQRSLSSKKKPMDTSTSRTDHTNAASSIFANLEHIKNSGLIDLQKLKTSPATRSIDLERLGEVNSHYLNGLQSKPAHTSNGSKRVVLRNLTSKAIKAPP